MLQIQSVEHPFGDPDLASAAVAALSRADAMGLLAEPVDSLDDEAMVGLGSAIEKAGIGRRLVSLLASSESSDPAHLASVLEAIRDALDHSPTPAFEWETLAESLGPALLARLAGVSEISVRRYRHGVRATPDAVAARVHFIALVVGDLAGAYNDVGIRRWFDRRRQLLDGRTPAEELGASWSPEDAGPQRVRALAHALVSFLVT